MNSTRDALTFRIEGNRIVYDRQVKWYGATMRMYSLAGKSGVIKHKLYAFIRERYY